MPKKDETAIAPILQEGLKVQVDAKISKDDLVAVAVSRQEEKLLADQLSTERAIDQLFKDKKKLEKERETLIGELGKGKMEKKCKQIEKALAKFGITAAAEEVCESSNEDHEVKVSIHVRMGKKKDRYHYTHGLILDDENVIVLPFPQRYFDIGEELNEIEEQIASQKGHLTDVVRGLTYIPALERKARAKIAEMLLNSSEESGVITKILGELGLEIG